MKTLILFYSILLFSRTYTATIKNDLTYIEINKKDIFVLNDDVTTQPKNLNFIIDFQSPEILLGVQKAIIKISGKPQEKQFADFGVSICNPTEQCELTYVTTAGKKKYKGVEVDTYQGKIAMGLGKGQKITPGKSVPVTFIASKKAVWKFDNYNILGLNPKSKFWAYIADAYKWDKDTIELHFQAVIGGAKPFSDDATGKGILNFGNQVGSNGMESTIIGLTQSSWEFGSISVVIPDKNVAKKRRMLADATLISKGKFCVAPDYPGFIVLDKENPAIDKAIWKHICKMEKECPKSLDLGVVPHLMLDFGGKIGKKEVSVEDLVFKGKNFLEKGWITNKDLFASGGACEGYKYAVGRNFFGKRFGLLLSVPKANVAKSNGFSIGVSYTQPPKVREKVTKEDKSFVLKWIIISVLAFIVLIPIVCYCLNRTKKRAELEESFDE